MKVVQIVVFKKILNHIQRKFFKLTGATLSKDQNLFFSYSSPKAISIQKKRHFGTNLFWLNVVIFHNKLTNLHLKIVNFVRCKK